MLVVGKIVLSIIILAVFFLVLAGLVGLLDVLWVWMETRFPRFYRTAARIIDWMGTILVICVLLLVLAALVGLIYAVL